MYQMQKSESISAAGLRLSCVREEKSSTCVPGRTVRILLGWRVLYGRWGPYGLDEQWVVQRPSTVAGARSAETHRPSLSAPPLHSGPLPWKRHGCSIEKRERLWCVDVNGVVVGSGQQGSGLASGTQLANQLTKFSDDLVGFS